MKIFNTKCNFTLVELLSVLTVIAILISSLFVCLFPTGIWVPESRAVTALETQGFSDIRVTDKDIWFVGWKGGHNDSVRFTASATNPIGKRVTVYVFAGWPFKGATIRTL